MLHALNANRRLFKYYNDLLLVWFGFGRDDPRRGFAVVLLVIGLVHFRLWHFWSSFVVQFLECELGPFGDSARQKFDKIRQS